MATSLLGAGYTSAGNTVAGFGTPATADAPPALGAAAEALEIDPLTKDYARDDEGRITGWTGAQQCVYLALATLRGSAIDPELGLSATPDRITSATIMQMEDDVRRALGRLVAAGSIAINEIKVWRDATSRVCRRVRWTDLTTGRPEVTNG
jgi:hypothetical protein